MSIVEPTDKPGPGKPRFLAPIGQPRDYVDRPAMGVHGEPECISDEIVDGYASIANFHKSQAHAMHVAEAQLIRPMLPPESRLSDLRRRAKHSNVDISHTLHILERDVRKARMRVQPVPVRVLERLESLEGLLDGVAA
jgi:hypothetical protein